MCDAASCCSSAHNCITAVCMCKNGIMWYFCSATLSVFLNFGFLFHASHSAFLSLKSKTKNVTGADRHFHHSIWSKFSAPLKTGPRWKAGLDELGGCGRPRLDNDDPFQLVDANTRLARPAVLKSLNSANKVRRRGNFTLETTIVGGQDTMPGDVCWQAKIHRDGFFYCGGSIIGKRTILTAAHCVHDYQANKAVEPMRLLVTVGAPLSNTNNAVKGSKDPSGCAQEFTVSEVILNSRYNKKIQENDIALVKLGSDIDFNRRCVCPVCLFSRLPLVGEICSVSGYGRETEAGEGRNPRPLKFAHINMLETKFGDECAINKGYGEPPNLNNLLCAGNVVGQDSCQGDSGGPAVCFDQKSRRHYQAGIVSYGRGCGRGIGGIYTRVSSFLNWIKAVAGGDVLGMQI
ncbi:trypsin-1-like isoform X2 [Paramacrobiotus metropolitanus]|uniref:trypsin-1-like isoform X2 n=1 Tax=Paramacrobiotus metropolitanus TaxID=2943436 RepID=UPI002445660C|nr:trypsin-1-like isoform X2 [Paramacrobiotus metropolitanus]